MNGPSTMPITPPPSRPARARGFTLVELLVTLVVAAILASYAVPSFTRMTMNNSVTTQTNDLLAAFKLARSEASRRGIPIAVTNNTGINFHSGYKVFTNLKADGVLPTTGATETNGTVLRINAAAPTGLSMKRVKKKSSGTGYDDEASGTTSLVFNARGGVSATAFVKVCSSTMTSLPGRIIQVTPLGKAAVIDTQASCT